MPVVLESRRSSQGGCTPPATFPYLYPWLPKIYASRPTTTKTRSWKMALTQCAESVGNFKKQLTTLFPDALNLPRQSTYKDTIKLQHISIGQYANTITSKHKINTTNMHEPATTVTEYQTTTILWDMPIQTDRDKNKQTRYSRERHEGKNLSAYRFVYPHRN